MAKTAKTLVSAIATIALALMLAGCSQAQAEQTEPQAIPIQVKITAPGADGTVPAKVDVTDSQGETLAEGIECAAGEAVQVAEIPEGETATIAIASPPVNADGSTYEVPDPVETDGTEVVEIELSAVPLDQMTEEQLEAETDMLAESGDAEAAAKLQEKASTAPSTAASAPAQPGAPATSGSISAPAPQAAPAHEHSWIPQYTTQKVKVGSISHCNICGYEDQSLTAHIEETLHGSCSRVYVYDDQQVLTGYRCSCGATK